MYALAETAKSDRLSSKLNVEAVAEDDMMSPVDLLSDKLSEEQGGKARCYV